jgi:hypothetical protein
MGQENIIRPVKGAKGIGFDGAVFYTADSTIYLASANFGYYISDTFELAADLSLFGGTGRETLTGIGLKGKYHFPGTSQFAPYVHAGVSTYTSGGSTASSAEGGVGFDYFMRPNQSVYLEASLFKPSDSAAVLLTTFGVRFFFK